MKWHRDLSACEVVEVVDEDGYKVIDLFLRSDPSKLIRYTIAAKPGGGVNIEADCEDEAWPTMKPYHDHYIAGLRRIEAGLLAKLN